MANTTLTRRNENTRVSRVFLREIADNGDFLNRFCRAVSRFSRSNKGFLADAIVMLGREKLGQKVVFAPDFELLHSYLFPSLQSKNSKIPPARARFILENFAGSIVLLPGTITELIRFAQHAYSEARDIGAEIGMPENITGRLFDQGDQQTFDYTLEAQEELESRVGRYRSLTVGLSRLHRFLLDERITKISNDLKITGRDPTLQGYIRDVHAKLLASREGPRKSSPPDAINIACASLAYSRSLEELPQAAYYCLVTQTRSMLRLDKRILLHDPAIREMLDERIVFDDHLRSERYLTPAIHAKSFAYYCYYRNYSKRIGECLKNAIIEFNQLLEVNTIANRFFARSMDSNKQLKISAAELRGISEFWSTFCQTAPPDLLGRIELSARRIAEDSSDTDSLNWLASDATDDGSQTEQAKDNTGLIANLIGHVVESVEKDVSEAFEKIGINRKEIALNPNDGDVQIKWASDWTNEQLLEISCWTKEKFITIGWETNADFELILSTVNQLVELLKSKCETFGVAAVYDVVNSECDTDLYPIGSEEPPIKLPPKFRSISWPLDGSPSPTSFILKSENGLGAFPETISVFTSCGDFHFATPFSARESLGMVCNIPSQLAAIEVVESLLGKTHIWQWNQDLVKLFVEDCNRLVREHFG